MSEQAQAQAQPLPRSLPQPQPQPQPQERDPGPLERANWRGMYTLYLKEVRRYIKVAIQTVMAPLVTTLLFLAVFSLALGRAVEQVQGIPFMQFLAPGLIMMAMIQNAFANSSSSVVVAKVQGNIVDVLMAPLSPLEMTLAFTFGAMTRGMMVGFFCWLAMLVVVPIQMHNPFFVLYHAMAATMLLSLIGLAGGLWADKFDHIAAVTNFVVTPLSFLSGTFYTVERLPGIWQHVAHFNPFFYMIDGFRYGFTGHADSNLWIGVFVLGLANLLVFVLAYRLLSTGYKLKA